MVTLEQKLQVTNSSHPGSKKKKAFFFKFSMADMCVCVCMYIQKSNSTWCFKEPKHLSSDLGPNKLPMDVSTT